MTGKRSNNSPSYIQLLKNWFKKKPLTKASYITAIATSVLAVITVIAVVVAIRESNLNHEMAMKAEAEKVVLQFYGGVECDDFYTEFAEIPSLAGPKKTIITTHWPIIISNNGQNTVSLVAYEATSRIYGRKRNIETALLDKVGTSISPPIVLEGGQSTKLFLVVPIHIPNSVLTLINNLPEFIGKFRLQELEKLLEKEYGIDIYGNEYRYAKKYAGVGEDILAAHIFKYNDDGMLAETSMQADQVTIEFKTSRNNYFTAKSLYYDIPSFREAEIMYLPQGKPANIKFQVDALDSLPKEK